MQRFTKGEIKFSLRVEAYALHQQEQFFNLQINFDFFFLYAARRILIDSALQRLYNYVTA